MNSTVLYIATSLDGYIAGNNDDMAWLTPYEGGEYGYEEFLATVGVIIEGRRTYDVSVERGFVKEAHPVPSLILSHTSPPVPDGLNITFIQGDAEEILSRAKKMTDKKIWIVGGAAVAQLFMDAGLIDEYIITHVPVILGSGVKLFKDKSQSAKLILKDMKKFENGLVQFTYVRK